MKTPGTRYSFSCTCTTVTCGINCTFTCSISCTCTCGIGCTCSISCTCTCNELCFAPSAQSLPVRNSSCTERSSSVGFCAQRRQTRECTHLSLRSHQDGGLWLCSQTRREWQSGECTPSILVTRITISVQCIRTSFECIPM